ncbi:hypothetical protein [Xanthovirga aplysinae]|uniref:hypothetical protein n=1 Tax=Xanthovirga aplysinae TaxID=2529853 RepID=UPI0012BC9AAF|nr:hypothetical protein [Xanthovirga aplysinae]MTI33237.1 hypothetical protein [Xanthovirga aplysinae]
MKSYILKFALLVIILFQTTCNPFSKKDIEGLWQLEEAKIDGIIRTYGAIFLQINADNSFAVSRVTGDFGGLYSLRSNKLEMNSNDQLWFNKSWKVNYFEDYLFLKGIEFGNKTTKLEFRKIDEIPDFQDFENKIVGNWQLYQTIKEGNIEKVFNTWFHIDGEGQYLIVDKNGLLEKGRVIINTRHKKVIFENDEMAWKAWFYGKELRLNHERLGIQYCLRKNEK